MISTSQKLFTGFRFQQNLFLNQKIVRDFKLLFKTQKKFSIVKNNESNHMKQANSENINLFNYQNYSIRMLTQKHQDSALKMFNQDFNNHNPFTNAYWRLFPEDKLSSDKQMHAFWQQNINNAIQNGLGIAVIDMEKDQLAGASIAQPFSHHNSNSSQEQQLKKVNLIDSVYSLLQTLIKTSEQKKKSSFKKIQKLWKILLQLLPNNTWGKNYSNKLLLGDNNWLNDKDFNMHLCFPQISELVQPALDQVMKKLHKLIADNFNIQERSHSLQQKKRTVYLQYGQKKFE